MNFTEYLLEEWKPALGCTEPSSIAFTASKAAALAVGPVLRIELQCDPRMYKNCFAAGIPHSGHKTGIVYALAIGALLPNPDAKLECFRQITPEILEQADALIASERVKVEVCEEWRDLCIDCRVTRESGTGRAVIQGSHTRLTLLEKNSEICFTLSDDPQQQTLSIRECLALLELHDYLQLARSAGEEDRRRLREGIQMNVAIAEHGESLFPEAFITQNSSDALSRASVMVCTGVYARMWGEDLPVMSLAGSGNKGITCSVPLHIWGAENGKSEEQIDEALALACLVTSATTHYLGALSAACGCSNAAGIGLAAGLVLLHGGSERQIDLAINNMVGNVTGMICDGAKIGCALKTMTSVDAAFRAATLAQNDIGIPFSDGIVGQGTFSSLKNLGRIATEGMTAMDKEILAIMQEKLP